MRRGRRRLVARRAIDGRDAPDAALEADDERADLLRRLDRLDDRERTILSLRFGLEGEAPLTLKEVGRRLGVTREWVRKIEIRAVRKLDDGDRIPSSRTSARSGHGEPPIGRDRPGRSRTKAAARPDVARADSASCPRALPRWAVTASAGLLGSYPASPRCRSQPRIKPAHPGSFTMGARDARPGCVRCDRRIGRDGRMVTAGDEALPGLGSVRFGLADCALRRGRGMVEHRLLVTPAVRRRRLRRARRVARRAAAGYREIDHPDAPRHAHFPPGYPVALAVLWRVDRARRRRRRTWLSLACHGGAPTLAAWRWFRTMYAPADRLAAGPGPGGQLDLGTDRRRRSSRSRCSCCSGSWRCWRRSGPAGAGGCGPGIVLGALLAASAS